MTTDVSCSATIDPSERSFGALADPTRRRILELLVDGEQSVTTLVASLQVERRLSQPAVSQHLRILKDAGLVVARAQGTRRLYQLRISGLLEAAGWLTRLADEVVARQQPFDALDTELARGRRNDPHRRLDSPDSQAW